MRENLLRSFNEEAIRHAFRLVERHGQCLGFGLATEFFRRVPIGHPSIERIENDVAAALVIELFHKLAGRIVNNGAVAAGVHLIKHLANDARLAGAGVTHDQEVLVFGIARNTQG